MKNIKKFVGLLSLALVLGSCSDDDDDGILNPVVTSDLIGTWTLVSQFEDGTIIELDECTSQDSIVFTETTVTFQNFFLDEDTGECVSDGGPQINNYSVNENAFRVSDIDDDSDSSEGEIVILGGILTTTFIGEEGVEFEDSYRLN